MFTQTFSFGRVLDGPALDKAKRLFSNVTRAATLVVILLFVANPTNEISFVWALDYLPGGRLDLFTLHKPWTFDNTFLTNLVNSAPILCLIICAIVRQTGARFTVLIEEVLKYVSWKHMYYVAKDSQQKKSTFFPSTVENFSRFFVEVLILVLIAVFYVHLAGGIAALGAVLLLKAYVFGRLCSNY